MYVGPLPAERNIRQKDVKNPKINREEGGLKVYGWENLKSALIPLNAKAGEGTKTFSNNFL